MAKTPVLFVIFNRPETTKKVFEAIRKYQPLELYIAADGSRANKPGEKEKCEEARKITEKIDWPCKVKRLYRDKNLGCKMAVSGAITWFFKNVEEGIILEDDCLPNPSFFTFCAKMLELYRNDKRVMCISGDNFLPRSMQNTNGYYFSKYVHIWGWASWRRAWKNYDVGMGDWHTVKKTKMLNKYFDNFIESIYWKTIFNATYNGKIDTWDYQFMYHVWKNNGLSLVPNANLISNIGFSQGALHTKNVDPILSNRETRKLDLDFKKLKVVPNKNADIYEKKIVFSIDLLCVPKQLVYYLITR